MKRPYPQIRLDTAGSIPAYRQITDQLRTFVVEGVLAPGDVLPPVRRLALELAIHFNTVAEAYRALAEEGFLEIAHGQGARVLDRTSPPRPDPEVAKNFRQKLRELIAVVRARGLSTRQILGELESIAEALEKR